MDYLDFLYFKREKQEDALLAKRIKEGLEDEFLSVKEAKKYLEELRRVENQG